jgi:hypothetical protein
MGGEREREREREVVMPGFHKPPNNSQNGTNTKLKLCMQNSEKNILCVQRKTQNIACRAELGP